jgi:hypothetical protein
VYRSVELIAAFEKVDFEDEQVTHQLCSEFLNKYAGCLRGSAYS